jgi:hypothetical protein
LLRPLAAVSTFAVLLLAREARADLALYPGLVGSRTFYAGLEADFSLAKTTPGTSAGLLGFGPTLELHLDPRWSIQAHGSWAFGFGKVYPDSWWQVGLRGVWRATPAQFLSLGVGVAQPTEARYQRGVFDESSRPTGTRVESAGPQIDLGLGIWELDLDPVRLCPVARFAVALVDGSYLLGVGVQAQYGWGAVRTSRSP